jgi:FeS assembly SUF system protein
MRSPRPSVACVPCWGCAMGLFSFLTGKDDETGKTPLSSDTPQTPIEYEPGIDPASLAGDPGTPGGLNIDALTAPIVDPAAEQPIMGPVDPKATAELQPLVVEQLKTVYDPEIPVDIYELGLVYDILVDAEHRVLVKMTLTSPACPSAQQIPSEARYKIKAIPGVANAWVEIVWEPPWGKERMSEAAKLSLGFF